MLEKLLKFKKLNAYLQDLPFRHIYGNVSSLSLFYSGLNTKLQVKRQINIKIVENV